MIPVAVFPYLSGWTVVSLRPAAQEAAALRAIDARGARGVSLPGLVLEAIDDAGPALYDAVACRRVIFTSPAAVAFAHAQVALDARAPRVAIAVGSGTANALAAHGIAAASPHEMRSEGVLSLPQLDDGDDAIGLVTAPGGRGALEPALRARGLEVKVAHVYRRALPAWRDDAFDVLVASRPPRAVLVTSGEALRNVLDALQGDARGVFLDAVAACSSERLAQLARDAGFESTLVAASPALDGLLDALAAHAKGAGDPVA